MKQKEELFSVWKQAFGRLDQYYISNKNSGEFLSVLPGAGGRMNELVLQKEGVLYAVLRGYTSYQDFLTDGIAQFRGAKLFPYPGRVKNALYKQGNDVLTLPRNDFPRQHSVHGLVHNSPFKVSGTLAGERSGQIDLQISSDGNYQPYPFKWSLDISYLLKPGELTITTVVTNTGDTNMPFGDGWHPYFTFSGSVDELFLKIDSEEFLEFDPAYIPTGNLVSGNKYKEGGVIGDDPLHRCYVLDRSPGIHRTLLKDPHEDVTLEIWQEKGPQKYNFVQFYIPPGRESLAIEPYTCPSDALNSGTGLITLEKGSSLTLTMGIRIS